MENFATFLVGFVGISLSSLSYAIDTRSDGGLLKRDFTKILHSLLCIP